MKNKKLRNGSHSRACSHTQEKFPAVHDLLSSRLYCRPRNFTESCLAARGLYHRWGIAPRPEDPDSIKRIIGPSFQLVKSGTRSAGKKKRMRTHAGAAREGAVPAWPEGVRWRRNAMRRGGQHVTEKPKKTPPDGSPSGGVLHFNGGTGRICGSRSAAQIQHHSSSRFLRPRKVTPARPVPERSESASHRADTSPVL